MTKPLFAGTTLLAALGWIVALIVEPGPLEWAPALLYGIGLLATATVATVGMVVVGGRWAHRLGLVSLGFGLILAVIRPIDVWWVVAVVLTGLATVALLSPAVTNGIRKLPSASGPPPRAIAPPLILLAAPCALGLAGNEATPWALLVVGLSAPNFAFLYSRVIPGGLLGVRLIWPITALVLSPLLGLAGGITAAVLAVVVGAVSWHEAVKASYHPPVETGTTFPIPPELAPQEVLDAADIDDTGRRR